MSRLLLAANWKMHLDLTKAQELTSEVAAMLNTYANEVAVVLCVPAPFIQSVWHLAQDHIGLKVGAQNLHEQKQGAFTGEISGEMLKSVCASYVLVGHSERRQLYGETDELIAQKLTRALEAGLIPIFCVGETLEERESGRTAEVIERQIRAGLFTPTAEAITKIVLAYEPVWAIGTGKTASPEQAQEVHLQIRTLIRARFGDEIADNFTILYGGSVKASNAAELFAQPDIDGGLVGGASLQSREFVSIAEALR
jgi:triosephosphate isomerase (TIM)